MRPTFLPRILPFVLLPLLIGPALLAQGSARDYEADEANLTVPEAMLENLEFRSVGFSRGGRSTAVTGVRGNPLVYYFGGTGGGVFKTSDAGNNWKNVTDDYLGVGSIGAIAVADSDPNVVYVGTGSACPRGNISNGDGIYKSTDAGETWSHIGLPDAGQIGRVRVHPRNEELVYAAVLGNMFGPNEERGIYRSENGGESWEKILFVSEYTGFVDLAMDANNPRVLYAAAWRAERKPWSMISGSEEGGLWKSTDGGDNWEKLEGGLPEGMVGRIGVAVSPADSSRVWALVEAPDGKGGLYRSDDAGKKWRKVNDDAKLKQRPWYYTHVYADPRDADTVYALNTGFYKSVDGGKTFPWSSRVPHGDNHDLWLNPDNPSNMINSNDGGANVSFDGGESWSWQMNQPTAEIYRVFVDNQWPYRIYGSQQDNSTISVPSFGFVAWNRQPPDWYPVGGCESGHIAIDPRNPDVTYAGCYGGSITREDRGLDQQREVITYPQLQLGQAPRDLKYRFQWNAPIRISPHDPDVVYHTSQVVHRTDNAGQSWEVISPDLTTDNLEQQDFTGGPISHDSTGVEVYNTIFAFEESPARKGELWAGTDDGRLHVSRNAGGSWDEVTPAGIPAGATINSIDISAHDPDRIHIAAYRYRENDFRPYIYQSNDSGASWKLLTTGTNGIPATNFTRVVREDPQRKGLLFAGTEFGLYVSFDDGDHWQRLENNLPVTPVTDLVIQRNDLVIATQGRSFWVLDDLTPLQQLTEEVQDSEMWLFSPHEAYRGFTGARIHFYVADVPESEGPEEGEGTTADDARSGEDGKTAEGDASEAVKLAFLRGDEVIRELEWKPGAEDSAEDDNPFRRFRGSDKLTVKKGLNSFRWNLREEAPEAPKGVIHWGFTPGLSLVPGEYTVRLSRGEWSQSRPLTIKPWPTGETSQAGYEEQYELGQKIAGRLTEIYEAIETIRDLKGQTEGVSARMKKIGMDDEELTEAAKGLTEKLEGVETQLTQVKSKSGQDPLNYPPMIDNQYVELYAYVVASDYQPPAGAYERWDDLDPQLTSLLGELEEILSTDVVSFNEMVASRQIPAIAVSGDEESSETDL